MAAIRKYTKQLFKVAAEKRFWLCILGEVDGEQIWLVRTRPNTNHKDPKFLVAAGFHGEEKAGPFAALKWLKSCDVKLLKKYDISFIPIVNPIGFRKNTRYNTYGERTNCGFCHPESKDVPSREGRILINNIDLLRPLANDGFLSMHEDVTTNQYYLYSFEDAEQPSDFTFKMRDELGQHFPRMLFGPVDTDASEKGAGPKVEEGIVFNLCDGSFEDWLFHLGVPRCVVTETPGKYDLRRRVRANVSAINKFIKLNLELKGE